MPYPVNRVYQYTLTMNEVPNTDPIKVGDKFRCIIDGRYYTLGKEYVSEKDGCITDDEGDEFHGWGERRKLHFERVAPDRDYFQSIQEALKANYVADASQPIPGPESFTITTAGEGGTYTVRAYEKTTEALITEECDSLKNLLIEKNRKYGDSAISRGILFDMSASVAIKARLNDKLARWKNDNEDEDDDITKDILGYIVLLRIALNKEKGL